MIIKKVLNSSVVLIDDNGQEKIALGKGIGFGKKAGELVAEDSIDKLFQSVNEPQSRYLLSLLDEVPDQYFELSSDIIDYGKQLLGVSFPEMLLLSLTDHLFFCC